MLPFLVDQEDLPFENGDYIFIPDIAEIIRSGGEEAKAYVVNKGMKEFTVRTAALTEDERRIISDGCLINYYRNNK